MEGSSNHFGDHAGRPSFVGIPGRDGSGEDDLPELLFLFVVESGGAPGTFLPCECVEFTVLFLESASPVFNGRDGNVENVDDFIVVEVFENQSATLKPCDGLGR